MKVSFLMLAILLTSVVFGQTIERGPYLQKVSATKINIKWRTDSPLNSKVWYGTSLGNLTQSTTDNNVGTNHEVILTGLQPSTTYYYAIGSTLGQLSAQPNYHFKTSPNIGTVEPIRTWVIGDFGKGNQSQLDVMNAYLNYTGARGTDVWLWMGDNAYQDGNDSEYQTKVFNQYDSIFPFMPFFPTPGNHDYNSMSGYNLLTPTLHTLHSGAYYDIISVPENGEIGGHPSGTEAFYSFDYGNVHYISLNSEIQNTNSRNSAMESWLTQDLAQNTQDWTIVYFHQAPYSRGSHDSDDIWEIFMRGMRKNILPILDAGGADLVLSGHSHNYERSYLMKGHYDYSSAIQPSMFLDGSTGNPDNGEPYKKYYGSDCSEDYEGIVYAVVGNSGSKTGPGDDEGLNHPAMYISDAENAVGSLVLDILADTLTGTYMRSDGQVIDKFQIQRVGSCDTTTVDTTSNNIQEHTNNVVVKVFSDYKSGDFKIRFDLTENSPVSINVHDMNGRLIYTKDFGHLTNGTHYHTIQTELNNIPAGMYNFSIITNKSMVSKRIFKLKI
ncbi:MAG: metallophosphoesterase [Flavobacteriales bacterium]|nr:metallophosphoesterase [Flavobacteriales bacterium]